MINIADNPAVRAQIQQATANMAVEPAPQIDAVEYARAPAASGPPAAGSRPPATQGTAR